jgi:hypothetical protein
MTLNELDKKWNEILTLLGSDDSQEREKGEEIKKKFYSDYPDHAFDVGYR